MKRFLVIAFLLTDIVSLLSCGSKDKNNKDITKTVDAPKENEHQKPDETTLTAEQMKTIGIELGSIEQKQLTASLKTNGVLKVPNQNKASIN